MSCGAYRKIGPLLFYGLTSLTIKSGRAIQGDSMIKFCAWWYGPELEALAVGGRDAWDTIGVSHPDSVARIGSWC